MLATTILVHQLSCSALFTGSYQAHLHTHSEMRSFFIRRTDRCFNICRLHNINSCELKFIPCVYVIYKIMEYHIRNILDSDCR